MPFGCLVQIIFILNDGIGGWRWAYLDILLCCFKTCIFGDLTPCSIFPPFYATFLDLLQLLYEWPTPAHMVLLLNEFEWSVPWPFLVPVVLWCPDASCPAPFLLHSTMQASQCPTRVAPNGNSHSHLASTPSSTVLVCRSRSLERLFRQRRNNNAMWLLSDLVFTTRKGRNENSYM